MTKNTRLSTRAQLQFRVPKRGSLGTRLIICLLFNIIVCIYTRGDSVTIMFVQEVFSDEELLTMHCRIMFVQEVFSDEKLLASKYGGNSKKVLQ